MSSRNEPERVERPPTAPPKDTLGAAAQGLEPTLDNPPNPAALAPPLTGVPAELAGLQGYEIVRELGRGGMGVVYLAHNRLMDRPEVLKVMSKALVGQPAAVERFLQEIRSAARLNHPNVVTAHSAHQLGELLVLTMEYVEGDDLSNVVHSRGPLSIQNACYCVHQAARALQRGHELGLVHRDIKPSNLLLAKQGKQMVVKVIDFGLAKARSEVATGRELTGANQMMGTPGYTAPEQLHDAKSADTRSDIYSLGCTLYCLLTGNSPFQGSSVYAVILAQQAGAVQPLRELRPEVPEALAAVVAKMMAPNPADRYREPGEVAEALLPFIKQRPKDVAPATPHPAGGATTGPTGPDPGRPRPATMPQPDPAAPAPLAVSAYALASAIPVEGRRVKSVAARRQPPPRSVRRWLPVVSGVVLLCGVLGVAGAIALRGKTSDGTAVVENVAADKAVRVVRPALPPPEPGAATAGSTAPAPQSPAPRVDARPRKDGFFSLFNGKDLTGWASYDTPAGTFSVEDGLIVASGKAKGWLLTDEEFADFDLSLEYRIEQGANSGVAVRAAPQKPALLAMEIQIIDDEYHRNFPDFRPEMRTGAIHGVKAPSVLNNNAVGAWNRLHVIAAGRRVVVEVNDLRVVDYEIADADVAGRAALARTAGRIGLQSWDGRVEFRDLLVKRLEPAAATPEVRPQPTPTRDSPRVTLFDGEDLAGWVRTRTTEPANWKVVRGEYLEVVPGSGDIQTVKQFAGDFQLHVEFWVPYLPDKKGQARGNSGVFVQGRYEVQILDSYGVEPPGPGDCGALYGQYAPSANACRRPETWQTYDITFRAPKVDGVGRVVEQPRLTVVLNGTTVLDDVEIQKPSTGANDTDMTRPGPVRLQEHGSRVRFRNIRVKELP